MVFRFVRVVSRGFCPCWLSGGLCEFSVLLLVSPARPKLQKSSCCLPKVLPLSKLLFCVCSCPLTKSFPRISFNSHLPSLFLSCFPSLFFFCPFIFCCFAARLGCLSRLPLVVLPWPCDDCALYQSVTCVLAQPLPVPYIHRVDLCAAAVLTDRRAAWLPLCRPTEHLTLLWWDHLLMFMWLTLFWKGTRHFCVCVYVMAKHECSWIIIVSQRKSILKEAAGFDMIFHSSYCHTFALFTTTLQQKEEKIKGLV